MLLALSPHIHSGWDSHWEKMKRLQLECRVRQVPPYPCVPPLPSHPTPSTSPWTFHHSYLGHIHGTEKACGSWKNPRILCKFTPGSFWCEYITIWMETWINFMEVLYHFNPFEMVKSKKKKKRQSNTILHKRYT